MYLLGPILTGNKECSKYSICDHLRCVLSFSINSILTNPFSPNLLSDPHVLCLEVSLQHPPAIYVTDTIVLKYATSRHFKGRVRDVFNNPSHGLLKGEGGSVSASGELLENRCLRAKGPSDA